MVACWFTYNRCLLSFLCDSLFNLRSVHRDRSIFSPSSPTHTWFTSGVYREGVVTWDEEGLVTTGEEINTYWHNRPSPENKFTRIAYVYKGDQTLMSYGPGHAKTSLMPYANNKGTDPPAHPRSPINTFAVRYLDSMICILAISKVSRF